MLKPNIGFHRETKRKRRISSGNQKIAKAKFTSDQCPVCFNMAVPWPCNVHIFPFKKLLKPKVGFHRETKKKAPDFIGKPKKNTGFHRESKKTSENPNSIGVTLPAAKLSGFVLQIDRHLIAPIRKFATYSKTWSYSIISQIYRTLAEQLPPRLAINCRGNSGKLMSRKISWGIYL